MSRVLLFNKPFGVICQFTPEGRHRTLKDFIPVPAVYPAGRLDTDSEGLMVLTDDGRLQSAIANPRHQLPKGYWAQVEGIAGEDALGRLRAGVTLNDGATLPAKARAIDSPEGLWDRAPPIRVRRAIPTSWIEIQITEGRNRQVRRMTAAVGLPTLRLVRFRIGPWNITGLESGMWCDVPAPTPASLRDTA